MFNKPKPNEVELNTDDKGVISYNALRPVRGIGGGAHILLPRELLGRFVHVTYSREEDGDYKDIIEVKEEEDNGVD